MQVAVFLRKMEYFRGLLFLTTNRIGQIDDAFLSRIHVVLEYETLDDGQRKQIWNGFFQKLERDMVKLDEIKQTKDDEHNEETGSTSKTDKNYDNQVLLRRIEVNDYAKEYVTESPEILSLKWNGREIRNAFQTAISLAGYQALKENKKPGQTVRVKKEHFSRVVEMSRKFHKYVDDIQKLSEAQRAKARLDRNDSQAK
jgi:SpoVK/Ycf46/Vps4 family AAA+-type ATPase